MAVSNACPDREQIFKVIAGKLGKWPARGKREGTRRGGGERGGAQGNVILFLTCLSLLNLLIEICMAKLLRTLMPALFPPPCLHFAICVLVELYKVLCIILHSNNNSKGNNNYLAHDVFLAIELPPSRGTWPNFTADQATATTSSLPPLPNPAASSSSSLSSSSSSLSATSHRHCYYHCALSQFLLSLRFSYNLQ